MEVLSKNQFGDNYQNSFVKFLSCYGSSSRKNHKESFKGMDKYLSFYKSQHYSNNKDKERKHKYPTI